MPQSDLNPRSAAIIAALASDRADRYIQEVLLPNLQHAARTETMEIEALRTALSNPFRCLQAFFAHYAFSRRGKDKDELASMAVIALRRITDEESFPKLLEEADGNRLWEAFCQVCQERRRKNSEQLNRGLLAGMLELAQEVNALEQGDSIIGWIVRGARATDRIEAQFLRIVDIRGVGPKTTSTFLRDVAFLFELEARIDPLDRLYIQPVDRWLRLAAQVIVPELDETKSVDWVIAGKLAKYSRIAGVSGIRFNMGASYFGTREVREADRYPLAMEDLIQSLGKG
ncbi:MAG TPA: hypothetical protein PLH94_03085 [Fimbriimonadaceae bacterium]|nr:hypothetical protein [Fimbriimonadaceae bacterium]